MGAMRRDDLRPAVFGTATRDRVLIRLALSENGLHVRELARQIESSANAVHRVVIALERAGVVVSRPVGTTRIVLLNKRWYGAVELRALLERLAAAYPEVGERARAFRERPRRIGKPS
jgi:DNA-binding transcriptional ArsR family regulator